jgi:hypothetical protein
MDEATVRKTTANGEYARELHPAARGLGRGPVGSRTRARIEDELAALAEAGFLPSAMQLTALRDLTAELVEASGTEALEEVQRFDATSRRTLAEPFNELCDVYSGKRVLVTGGTGCIGTVLLDELSRFRPTSLISLSRGVTMPPAIRDDVRYEFADVADVTAVRRVMARHEPEIVLHLAAQRDPGRAEVDALNTIRTNVCGTNVMMKASADAGVQRFVHASTGKALRPYTRDLYAATKRVAEWIVATTPPSAMARAYGRFTHVVDNSIVMKRIYDWIDSSGVVRLHAPRIRFYIQSARESAQLLLIGGAIADEPGRTPLLAIRDLGMFASLTDLACGAMFERGKIAPILFSGFDPGYEDRRYPGLYVPETSVDISPLISSFEASDAETAEIAPDVDVVATPAYGVDDLTALKFESIREAVDREDAVEARGDVDDLLQVLLRARVDTVHTATLHRIATLTEPLRDSLSSEHKVIDKVVVEALRGTVPEDVTVERVLN